MGRRNTQTGKVLELMILPALQQAGYVYRVQEVIGERLRSGKHKIDALVTKDGRQFLVSVKWQQSSGTTEQKVPFEVISLVEALRSSKFEKAYLVLAGTGWKKTLKDFYVSGGLRDFIRDSENVVILGLEEFVVKANQRRL
jgi:hypothetical protein